MGIGDWELVTNSRFQIPVSRALSIPLITVSIVTKSVVITVLITIVHSARKLFIGK